MIIRIKKNLASARQLVQVNVPICVIDEIMGEVLEADEQCNIMWPWLGKRVKWSIPAECVEILIKNKA